MASRCRALISRYCCIRGVETSRPGSVTARARRKDARRSSRRAAPRRPCGLAARWRTGRRARAGYPSAPVTMRASLARARPRGRATLCAVRLDAGRGDLHLELRRARRGAGACRRCRGAGSGAAGPAPGAVSAAGARGGVRSAARGCEQRRGAAAAVERDLIQELDVVRRPRCAPNRAGRRRPPDRRGRTRRVRAHSAARPRSALRRDSRRAAARRAAARRRGCRRPWRAAPAGAAPRRPSWSRVLDRHAPQVALGAVAGGGEPAAPVQRLDVGGRRRAAPSPAPRPRCVRAESPRPSAASCTGGAQGGVVLGDAAGRTDAQTHSSHASTSRGATARGRAPVPPCRPCVRARASSSRRRPLRHAERQHASTTISASPGRRVLLSRVSARSSAASPASSSAAVHWPRRRPSAPPRRSQLRRPGGRAA